MTVSPEVQGLLSMGIGGAILAIVVKPLLTFLFQEVKAQREEFNRFLDVHAQHEEEILREIKEALLELRNIITVMKDRLNHVR